MDKGKLSLAILAALAAAFATNAFAADKTKVTTQLEITVAQADIESADPALFDLNGTTKVSPASAGKCRKNREVEAFRVEAGRDRSLGKAKTNKRGKWYVRGEVPGSTSNGVYYAKVSKDTRGELVCKSDRSNEFVIDFDPA